MKQLVRFRFTQSNKRAIDDVAAHGKLSRSEAIDVVVAKVTINDLTDAIRHRYEQGKEAETVHRIGVAVTITEGTIDKLDDISIRTGLPRETVLRLAIEAYYVKFLSANASNM